MKTLKCIFLAVFFLSAAFLNAQEKKTTFGVKLGLNVSNVTSDKGSYDNTKDKSGLLAGVTLDYLLPVLQDSPLRLYLLTGLEYSAKGVKVELTGNDQDVTAAYVQLPVSAGLKIGIGTDMAVMVNLGMYFGYGIHGKIKQGSSKIDTFDDNTLKNFDCGALFGAAFEWKKLCFSTGLELGAVNIMQKGNDKAKTSNFFLAAGYKF